MNDLHRNPGWQQRLIAYLATASQTPFAPGAHDCALFAAGAIEAMTGVDLAADWRGRYSTIEGGLKRLRQAGLADHLALTSASLPAIAPAFARPGDVAAVAGEDGAALGIVQGHRVYVLRPEGLATVSLLDAIAAWRVP